jgi:hypothetical protein
LVDALLKINTESSQKGKDRELKPIHLPSGDDDDDELAGNLHLNPWASYDYRTDD